MAIIEMKVPSPGESITEVQIARWIRKDGDFVEKDEELCEIDSDKATLTLNAEESGRLKILVKDGETIEVGKTVCTIDTSVSQPAAPAVKTSGVKPEEIKADKRPGPAAPAGYAGGIPSVAAEKLMREKNISADKITATGRGGRITKGDVLSASSGAVTASPVSAPTYKGERKERREPMSMLRKKVAERLVSVKQETAMLTTFNEVDMSAIISARKRFKDTFREKYGVSLGFMSFFTRAVCEALMEFPAVNAMIDGKDIIYHDYCDIGIAVSAPKGLMVPVLQNAESMGFAEIESRILELAGKAREGRLSIDEMTGGTFTITNGGVFGSMLSTPIINPPQSAILGMHNIVERPVAINGLVEIRPVMYVALSYDHRIIDGRESVSFLVRVKQLLEDPARMLSGGKDPVQAVIGL